MILLAKTFGHENMKTKKKRSYWYRFTYYQCVLCGKEEVYKERVYKQPKPQKYWSRHIYEETACTNHF